MVDSTVTLITVDLIFQRVYDSWPACIFQPAGKPLSLDLLLWTDTGRIFGRWYTDSRLPFLKILYDRRHLLSGSVVRGDQTCALVYRSRLLSSRISVQAIKSSHNYAASDRCIVRGETLRGLLVEDKRQKRRRSEKREAGRKRSRLMEVRGENEKHTGENGLPATEKRVAFLSGNPAAHFCVCCMKNHLIRKYY